jgi:hypothetical protein
VEIRKPRALIHHHSFRAKIENAALRNDLRGQQELGSDLSQQQDRSKDDRSAAVFIDSQQKSHREYEGQLHEAHRFKERPVHLRRDVPQQLLRFPFAENVHRARSLLRRHAGDRGGGSESNGCRKGHDAYTSKPRAQQQGDQSPEMHADSPF